MRWQAIEKLSQLLREKEREMWPYPTPVEARKAVYKDILEGFRNLDEAREYIEGMSEDNVIFTARGHEIPFSLIAFIIEDIEHNPLLSPFTTPMFPPKVYEYSINIPVSYRQAQTTAGRRYIRERMSEVRRRILERCPDAKITSGLVIGTLDVKCSMPLTARDLGRGIEITGWPSVTSYKLPSLLPAVVRPYTADKIFDRAKEYFGTTTNPDEAGYILPDGAMLDFSGKKLGGRGRRTLDHRDIAFAWPEGDSPGGFESMKLVMSWGAIRFLTYRETIVVNLVKPPTEAQAQRINMVLRYLPDAVLVVEVDNPELTQIDYRDFTYPFTNWRQFIERTADLTIFSSSAIL